MLLKTVGPPSVPFIYNYFHLSKQTLKKEHHEIVDGAYSSHKTGS